MDNKRIYLKLLYLIILVLIYFISSYYINKEEQKQLEQKYSTITKHMKENLSTLINDKKNATLAIAVSAAKDKNIKEALINNDNSKIHLDSFSLELRKQTRFKNVWFQIIDNKGRSFYRSWTNTRNDSLTFRPDVKNILKTKHTLTSISVGRYDMTFKSMIPIFKDGDFIGAFEVITHFNSITKALKKDKIDSIILAHKKFKNKLTHPLTNKFIEDYYVANLNAKNTFIDLIKRNNIEELLKIKDYKLIEENILTTYQIIEFKNEIIGYILLSKNINDIDMSEIKVFKKNLLYYVILTIILLGILFITINYYFYINNMKKINKELKDNLDKIRLQEKKNQTILDSQKNIILITDGEKLENANQQLLEFFDKYSSIEEYKKENTCICENFIDMKDKDYVINKDYNGKNWAEYILLNPHRKFKAAIIKNKKIHHFTLNINMSQFENENTPFMIVTLTDITEEIKQKEKLKNLNDNLESIVNIKTKELRELNESLANKVEKEILKSKDKDRLLFQQNKMAAMGEMLTNIAHQWRQPLSSISTAASSLKIKKEMQLLEEGEVEKSCDYILKNTQYLSHTIEDFRNFFKQDKEKIIFFIKDAILEDLSLLKDRLIYNNIEVVVNIEDKKNIYGYKNEFQQSILNILNNSIDAFEDESIKNEKIILIDYKNKILNIQDSAGGIDENIIEKIFEPYFTTKHQSQGTGIGLYMTQEILTKHMNCNLNVKNMKFQFKNIEYFGACFEITFNS